MDKNNTNALQNSDSMSDSASSCVTGACVLPDEALCLDAQKGSKAAADELVRRYTRLVSDLARRYYLIGGTQEDLRQEGMIGLLSAIREFAPGKASFKSFAGLCIRRSIIDAIRRSQNRNNLFYNEVLSFDQLLPDEPQVFPIEQDPEQQVIGKDDRKRIEQVLQSKLSDFERQVLSLYLNGFRYSEIAERLGKPVKSVDNAVQRIRKKLSS